MNYTALDSAKFVEWLLNELFFLAPDDSPEEQALLKASNLQELRVVRMEGVV